MQALTGVFPAANEIDPPVAPLHVLRCVDCGLVQLRHSVSVGEMFGENYGYRSGINATMKEHLGRIAAGLAARAGLGAGDAILDIGCNDGTLLAQYPVAGLRRFGIDPIAGKFRSFYTDDLVVHAGFFNAAAFSGICPDAKARVITSISMFYDLESPGAFTADIASILHPEGIWLMEQSYLPSMLERNSFDTICHEHLEYYALRQIERLAADNGLRVFDVSLNDINGGSFQLMLCHQQARHATNEAALADLRRREAALRLDTDAPFERFRHHVRQIGEQLVGFITEALQQKRKVYVYGASTKGNVLLQHYGLDHRMIAGCADRNPQKWGRRTPGTNIPILSEDEAREQADYFLVLPWHFREEFLRRESAFRNRGGKFIFPLPEFQVI